jgi:hypothetical protein
MLETNIQKERPLHGHLTSVCCLNLRFKTNIKEQHLMNGLRMMSYLLFNNVWFSDEAHFHFDAEVNKHGILV